jgi:hypothetical protein
VPSQSNQILGTPLKQFLSSIRLPYGSTDGADRYPGSYQSLYFAFRKAEIGW